ncbi:MAG: hypothetical protein ACF8XB_25140 [Planctomycetota bacterium JB042]
MPAITHSRSPTRSRGASIASIALLIVAVGVVVHLVRGGEIPLPFTDRTLALARAEAVAAAKRDLSGTLAVPISGRTISAYDKVVREDLIHPGTGTIATYPMRKDAIPENVLTDMKDVLGRVLAKDKPAGYVFTESDFLEKGTRPGVTAGIPAGKRAFRLDVSRINGLFGLARGDRFDLVSTQPIDGKPAETQLKRFGGAYGPALALDASFRNLTKRATVDVLVQNGVVVEPVDIRAEPVRSTSLTRGTVTRTRSVQEIVIAIDPSEIAPLTEALALDAEVTAWARSGRPDDPADSVTPSLEPTSPFDGPAGAGMKLVETIGGSARQIVPVPVEGSERRG